MSTVITWTFIPFEYEYKRAHYLWELPPPIIEKQAPFINEWSPPQEVVKMPSEWTQVVTESIPPVSVETPPMDVETPPIELIEPFKLWEVPTPSDFLESHVERAVNKAFDHIGSYIVEALIQLGQNFGMWILKVAPDTFGMIAMILCLGAIMSIPKTGKWAVITLSLSIVCEIVRRATI